MEILDQFNLWVRNISCIATKYGFFVEVEIQESYFTKIILDSDLCISEITLWGNNNLFVAEILDMRSSTTIYIDSGKYDSSINFSTFFNKFLQILELDVDQVTKIFIAKVKIRYYGTTANGVGRYMPHNLENLYSKEITLYRGTTYHSLEQEKMLLIQYGQIDGVLPPGSKFYKQGISMLIGSSSNTGDAVFFQKLFAINSEFEERNRKKLERIDYGGNVTSVIIFPISIYDEYEENLRTYNRYKFLDRFKNFDNKIEYCLNVNILISPLDVKRLSVEELKQLYCDLIVKTIENFDFKMPKNFDFLSFKRDFFNIVDDFRKIKVENTL